MYDDFDLNDITDPSQLAAIMNSMGVGGEPTTTGGAWGPPQYRSNPNREPGRGPTLNGELLDNPINLGGQMVSAPWYSQQRGIDLAARPDASFEVGTPESVALVAMLPALLSSLGAQAGASGEQFGSGVSSITDSFAGEVAPDALWGDVGLTAAEDSALLGEGAAGVGGGALSSIAPSGLPSGVGGFTPAGAGVASGEAAGPASTGFFGNMGNMVKGAFVNGDGSYNWGNIIKAGGTAIGALGAYHNSQNPGTPALPAGWNDHLNPTPLSRHVVGLGNDAAYRTYGQSGGEHRFFEPGPAPAGPATSAGPNVHLNDPTGGAVMRAGGHYIKGAGTGRSDEIDAKLSNDEYVMDAETVALLGDGSPEAGAKKLDQLRANIRKHKGQQLVKGKFSANAKDPAAYLPVRKAKGGMLRPPRFTSEELRQQVRKLAEQYNRARPTPVSPTDAQEELRKIARDYLSRPVEERAKGGRIRPPVTINSDLSQAYRGYFIKHNQMNDSFHISKDNAHISSPRSVDEAKKQIDELVGGPEEKFAKGGMLRTVPKIPVSEDIRAAQLAAVQRFRDAIKGTVQQPQPEISPIKKAVGGAVKAMNQFAEDLEREVLAKNPQRVAQLKSQMTAPDVMQILGQE